MQLKSMLVTVYVTVVGLICLSTYLNAFFIGRIVERVALSQAEAKFNDEAVIRTWMSDNGGLYLRLGPKTVPNLHLSRMVNWEISATDGSKLTLINSTHLIRLLHEAGQSNHEPMVHVTSLNPINPLNTPDAWERAALLAFERNRRSHEINEIVTEHNKSLLKVIRPLYVEEGCLTCHSFQGYKVGDLRGGLSIAIPLESLLEEGRILKIFTTSVHLAGFIICSIFIGYLINRLKKSRKKQTQYEQKLLGEKEKSEKANQAKTKFLATMSHDLRTPLNAIIGFSELTLLDSSAETLTQRQKDNIGRVAESGRHLLSLVQNLLDVSAIESGHIELRKESIDLKAMLGYLAPSYELLAKEKQIEFRCDIASTREIYADRHRLREVLNNLINNALTYTAAAGSVTLGVSDGVNLVTVYVKDTGIGIDKSDLERIFTPFEQVSTPGVYTDIKSVGLGLAICRQIVELHGGTLSVASERGKGSCFSFTIPYAGE